MSDIGGVRNPFRSDVLKEAHHYRGMGRTGSPRRGGPRLGRSHRKNRRATGNQPGAEDRGLAGSSRIRKDAYFRPNCLSFAAGDVLRLRRRDRRCQTAVGAYPPLRGGEPLCQCRSARAYLPGSIAGSSQLGFLPRLLRLAASNHRRQASAVRGTSSIRSGDRLGNCRTRAPTGTVSEAGGFHG